MKKYDSYKDSGVEWIGEVPRHWKPCRFKNFITLITDSSDSDIKIGLENIEGKSGKFIETNTEFEGNGIAFSEKDVVYGKLRPYLQKVWLAEFAGNAVGDFFVFRANNNSNSTYIKYLLLSDGFTKEADGSTVGAKMPRVSSEFILTMHYCLPTISEQQSIATYLDKKCSEIDKVISTQQKRIALLQELKQSVITHAVTKGLNPNVEMKDSGVEWIGEVPKHWDVCRLKWLFNNLDNLREPISAEKRERNNPQYDYYGASGIIDKIDYYNVDDKVLLIAEDGANLVYRNLPLIYKAAGKFWVNNHSHILKNKKGVDYEYMFYTLESADYSNYITGSAQPKLSQANLEQQELPIPSLSEQQSIATYLDKKCAAIDASISKAQHQVDLLQEYKLSLITEVVTGKRNVC